MWIKLNQNSLFAILLRSPWWVSGLVALAVFGLARLFLSWDFALFTSLPFIVITAYVGWTQLRAPGAARIAKAVERLRAMPADDFAAAIEAAYRQRGYAVSRFAGAQADFELVRDARSTLLACKRWKALRLGVEPLRELEAARQARQAHDCIYVAAGEITEQARAFAAEKKINVMQGMELATLLR